MKSIRQRASIWDSTPTLHAQNRHLHPERGHMAHTRALLRALKAWQQALGHDTVTITSEGVRLAQRPPPCMTFACGCVCPECVERTRSKRKAKPVKQPWDLAA